MKDLDRINFDCELCGGHVLSVEGAICDTSPVSCKACGATYGTFGDLKAKKVQKALNDILFKVVARLDA